MTIQPLSLEQAIKYSVIGIMIVFAVLTVSCMTFYLYFTHDLPNIETLKNYKPSTVSKIFSEEGELISEYFYEKREVASLDRMPAYLIQAFVAGEDARFYQHKGLNYYAIFRAFFRNFFSGEVVQGGSTITQQVVKSLLLSPKKSFSRKIREAILAYRIEKYLTKEEILYLYLNQIYLGHGAYGVASAAKTYFGKEIEDLNVAESAVLAGLPQSPTKSSPDRYPKQAKNRQIYILNRMVEEGFLTSEEAFKAIRTQYVIIKQEDSSLEKAPHFTEYIRRYVEDKYGKDALYKDGLQIYCTVDLHDQKSAQNAIEEGLKEIAKRQKYLSLEGVPALESALLCFDLETGYVKAMIGGRDFKKSQFNRAVQAHRQTGSAFKPIVYASAIDKGYTPASIIIDTPIVFESGEQKWKPTNIGGKFFGSITLRSALERSINTATVKIAQDIGVDYIREYAKKLGITSPLFNNLPMALGSSSVSLFELTRAYAIFANHGIFFQPIFVKKILDRDGNLLEENVPLFYSYTPSPENQIISPQTAFLMTYLLEGVVQHGTGWKARSLGRPAAGKTGTTDQYMDAWFVGYTPELITGVWVGFDEAQSIGKNEVGGHAALPIWVAFMASALKDKSTKDFIIPEGVEFKKIDPKTGQISSGDEGLIECFKEGTGPTAETPSSSKTSTDFFKFDFDLPTKP